MIIKFKSEEDRISGLGILFDKRGSFYGNSSGEFHVTEQQIKDFEDGNIQFEYVENPIESYPWENILKGKKKS
jgi:hypothetical protein